MNARDLVTPARTRPATGSMVSAGGRPRDQSKALLRRLGRLYAAERQLAFDLPRVFRQCTGLPLRLALSDQRKETSRQLVRLELILQSAGGAANGLAGLKRWAERPVDAHSDEDFPSGVPIHTVVAAALGQAQRAIAEYRAAMTLARRVGLLSMVDLLAISLNEKENASVQLARFAARQE